MRGLPVGLSTSVYGIVVGMLARQAGLSTFEAFLMSTIVFAGASQFVALGLWATPLPVLTIVLTTFVVNVRLVLMSAVLRPWFSRLPALKAYGSVFFMTDESWAVTMREHRAGERDAAFLLGSGLVVYVPWATATVLGHLLGSTFQDPATWGLDFAFTAVFLTLLVGLYRGKADIVPWAVAGAVALIGWRLLPGTWYILLGGIAGSVTGALRDAD